MIFPDLDHRTELVWSLLLFTGYLTYKKCELQEGKKVCSLIIPNTEIKYLFIHIIKNIFSESVMGGQADNLLTALIEGDIDMFSRRLKVLCLTA